MLHTTQNKNLSPLSRLLRLLHQHRRTINTVLIYAIFIGIVSLSLPLGIQAIIGQIAGGGISASWGLLTGLVVFGILFNGVLRYLQLAATEQLQRQLLADATFEFAIRIPHLDLERLRREHLPELVNRFFDVLTLQKGIPKILVDGGTAFLQIVFSLLVVSFYHPVFIVFSIFIVVLLVLILRLTFSRGVETSLKESKYKYKIAHWLEEVGRVATTFKLSGTHRKAVRESDELVNHYLDARRKHFQVLVYQFVGSLTLRILTAATFLVVGSLLVIDGALNIGQFVAAEILILFVLEYLEKVILMMDTVYDVLTATEKLGQFADLPLEPQEGIRFEEVCPEKKLSIEWRNLGYRFDDGRETLIGLNLSIAAGEKIAIVGYPAAGKSVLMQINSGLIRGISGSLLFNGLPINNLNINSLRENIGDLSSQEDIFRDSLLDNIRLGRDLPLSQILATIEAVGLNPFVQQLPEGINTELLPGGKGIPGSVVTKILVARAIVSQPALLVLEDPLNKLDTRDCLRISSLLTDKNQNWALLCSTDHPVLAALCDRVVVMREGQIVLVGTFAEIRASEHFDKIFHHVESL